MKSPFARVTVAGCAERDAEAVNCGLERFFAPAEEGARSIDGVIEADRQAHRGAHNYPEEHRDQFDKKVGALEAVKSAIKDDNRANQAWRAAGEHVGRIYDSARLDPRWGLFVAMILIASTAWFQLTWRETIVAISIAAAVGIGGRGLWSVVAALHYVVVAIVCFAWRILRLTMIHPVLLWKIWRRNFWAIKEQKLKRVTDGREQILRRKFEAAEAVARQAAKVDNRTEVSNAS